MADGTPGLVTRFFRGALDGWKRNPWACVVLVAVIVTGAVFSFSFAVRADPSILREAFGPATAALDRLNVNLERLDARLAGVEARLTRAETALNRMTGATPDHDPNPASHPGGG